LAVGEAKSEKYGATAHNTVNETMLFSVLFTTAVVTVCLRGSLVLVVAMSCTMASKKFESLVSKKLVAKREALVKEHSKRLLFPIPTWNHYVLPTGGNGC
jgi:hypothetical protein